MSFQVRNALIVLVVDGSLSSIVNQALSGSLIVAVFTDSCDNSVVSSFAFFLCDFQFFGA